MPQLRLNLGGEGEVADAINQQPEWNSLGTLSSRTGTPFGLMLIHGSPFLFCSSNSLPFPDESVDEVITNSVPIDQSSFFGSGVSSSEIMRVLKLGSSWIDNGHPIVK